MKPLFIATTLGTLFLTGCANTNYASYATATQEAIKAKREVDVARYNTEQARIRSLRELADSKDPRVSGGALAGLLLSATHGEAPAANTQIQLAPPQNEALEWARVLANPVATFGMGFLNYKLGVVQSNNSTKLEIKKWDSMTDVSKTGIDAASKPPAEPFVVEPMVVEVPVATP